MLTLTEEYLIQLARIIIIEKDKTKILQELLKLKQENLENVEITIEKERKLSGATLLHLLMLVKECDEELFEVSQKIINQSKKVLGMQTKNRGNTPLHMAAEQGHLNLVIELLCCNADPDAQNSDNQTPADLAADKNIKILIELASALKKQDKAAQQKLLNNEGLVQIDEKDTPDFICYKLIRTLLYKAKHEYHSWKEGICLLLRGYLTLLDKKFKNYSIENFNAYLKKGQIKNGIYFGSYYSDDSDPDSDSEGKIILQRKLDKLHAEPKLTKANNYRKKAKGNLFEKRLNDNRVKKEIEKTKSKRFNFMKLQERQKLERKISKQDKIDLAEINAAILEKDVQKLNALKHKIERFRVAKYRGINYFETKWNRPSRKKHRKTNEIGLAYYAEAVLKESEIDFYRHFKQFGFLDNEVRQQLQKNAEILKANLLELQKSPYSIRKAPANTTRKDYLHDNQLTAWQVDYSKGIKEHQKRIRELRERDPYFRALLPNHFNPRVSTSDLPYHALRYAYCLKDYYAEDFINPYWDKNGRAERPYLGKVYLSLHPLTDFLDEDKPSNLNQANYQGDSNLEIIIGNERETAFALMKEKRTIAQHIARVPSFEKKYKSYYLYKYGMTPELYEACRDALKRYKLYSPERQYVEQLILEWLAGFYEVVFLDFMLEQTQSSKSKTILVYQDNNGGFCFEPPPLPDSDKSVKKKRESRVTAGKYLSKTFPDQSFFTPEKLQNIQQSKRTPPDVQQAITNILDDSPKSQIIEIENIKPTLFKPVKRKLLDELSQPDAESMSKLIQLLLEMDITSGLNNVKDVSEQQLIEQAKTFGFECVDVERDGRCFFHSALDQLKRVNKKYSQYTAQKLIEIALDHILKNNINYYKKFDASTPDEFINRLMQPGEWADHIMIQALARALNVNIIIIRSDAAALTIIKTDDKNPNLFLGYQVGLHYQSLVVNISILPQLDIDILIKNAASDNFDVDEELPKKIENLLS